MQRSAGQPHGQCWQMAGSYSNSTLTTGHIQKPCTVRTGHINISLSNMHAHAQLQGTDKLEERVGAALLS